MAVTANAADVNITVNAGDTAGEMGALEVIFLFAFLSLLPSILLMVTSFTRIIIVLGFLRSALGTAQAPPNMVLVGLAFILSLFIMGPTLSEMNTVAFEPYQAGTITGTEAIEAATIPVKKFMLKQTNDESLNLFLKLSDTPVPDANADNYQEVLLELPLTVITPAFITSELSTAFLMGFLIFLPFLIVDIVVSSILMSMGMVMLPPAMISLPFKILLFVLVDGWNLMMETLVNSFTM
ncbi:MAG: flagellar type III secretion system pore protein FliP [Ruminococcaceae bacterium]|nr:flagellar type III secretion system pore protein FliP [Oscillospiraceae bacterium]